MRTASSRLNAADPQYRSVGVEPTTLESTTFFSGARAWDVRNPEPENPKECPCGER